MERGKKVIFSLIFMLLFFSYVTGTNAYAKVPVTVPHLKVSNASENDASLIWTVNEEGKTSTYALENLTTRKAYSVVYPNKSMTEPNLEKGKIYNYRVKMTTASGEVFYSNIVDVYTTATKNYYAKDVVTPNVEKVQDFEVIKATKSSVKVRWKTVHGATSYELLLDGDTRNKITVSGKLGKIADIIEYEFTNLNEKNNYTFSVSAVNKFGAGERTTFSYTTPTVAYSKQDTSKQNIGVLSNKKINAESLTKTRNAWIDNMSALTYKILIVVIVVVFGIIIFPFIKFKRLHIRMHFNWKKVIGGINLNLLKRSGLSILILGIAIGSLDLRFTKVASAQVVTAYPNNVDFEVHHYGEMIANGYVENPVLGSSTVGGSDRYGYKAGTYYKYAKSIEAVMNIPEEYQDQTSHYRYYVVVEPTISTYGFGGNGVTSYTKELYTSSDGGQTNNAIWAAPQNGQAVGASNYSVSTGYRVFSINGAHNGAAVDLGPDGNGEINYISYFPEKFTNFKYVSSYSNNYYETMKSISYRVYRQYSGITQEPAITVSPNQDYHRGTSNTFTIADPVYYANAYERDYGVKQYRINNGSWINYTSPTSITNEGEVEIQSRLFTPSGNIESNYGLAYSRQDNTPPSGPNILLDPNKWYKAPVRLAISPGTDSMSGVAGVDYRLSGATTQPMTRLNGLVSLSSEGITNITAVTTDNVGLSSTEVSQPLKIDNTPPIGNLTASSEMAKSNTIKIKATDSLSGMAFIGLPNNSWYFGSTLDYPITENGIYTFKFQDYAENISSQSITINNIDNDNPSIELSNKGMSWSDHEATTMITYKDVQGLDINKMYYKWTQSKMLPSSWDQATLTEQPVSINKEGQWYLHAKVSDLAGNTVTSISNVFQIQKQPEVPELNVIGITTDQILLNWSSPAGYPNGTTYTIKNKVDGRTWNVDYPINQLKVDQLNDGSDYDFTIQVTNHVGQSAESKVYSIVTLPAVTVRADVYADGDQYNTILVDIEGVKSATQYRVKATNWGTGNVDVDTIVIGTNKQPVSGLHAFAMYDIAISAINASGEGAPYHISFMTLPNMPGGFSFVRATEHSINLNWQSVSRDTYTWTVNDDVYYRLEQNNTQIFKGLDTQFESKNLQAGEKYNYALAAGNKTGFGAKSSLSVWTLPDQVQNLRRIESDQSTITFGFSKVSGATGYTGVIDDVYQVTIDKNATSYKAINLKMGTTHTFAISPYNSSGYGKTVTTVGTTLPADMSKNDLQIINISEDSITVKINEVAGATNYKIELNGSTYELDGKDTITLSGLEGSKDYQIIVTPASVGGSSNSNVFDFRTLPVTPTNIRVSSYTPSSFVTKWDEVKTAERYNIYDINNQFIKTVNTASYEAIGIKPPGVNTTYIIKAVNKTGEGKAGQITFRTPPGFIDNKDISNLVHIDAIETNSAKISWIKVEGADGYRVYDKDHQLIHDLSVQKVELNGFLSASRKSGYTIVPYNSTDEGVAMPVADFVTKPSSNYVISSSSTKKEITLSIKHDLSNETLVVSLNSEDKELYRGSMNEVTIDNLSSDRWYTFKVWTENEIGDRSEPKIITVKTTKETPKVIEEITSPTPIAVIDPIAKVNEDQKVEKDKESVVQRNGINFVDIATTYNSKEILELAELGIINGTTESTFEPDRQITRAEFMSIVMRAIDQKNKVSAVTIEPSTKVSFKDIDKDAWYMRDLQRALNAGIVKGYNKYEFRPNEPISRIQAVKMLANVTMLNDYDELTYTDSDKVSNWAVKELANLTKSNIAIGYPDGSFKPASNLVRCDAVSLLYRYWNT